MRRAAGLPLLTVSGRIVWPIDPDPASLALDDIAHAPPQAPRDPRDRLTAIMAEVGDVAAEIAKSVGDGRLSAGEIAAITKQGAQARAAIDALLRDLAAGPRLVGGVAKGGEGA